VVCDTFRFSALTLLVGRQEGDLKARYLFVGSADLSGVLHVL